jgi:hypothetical protein
MMTQESLNHCLERLTIRESIRKLLLEFDSSQITKKGIYVYGTPGSGKSRFVTELLASMGYDTIVYDAGDVRNKTLFSNIDSNHISNYNVLDLMNRKKRKIAILMDEIDGMNNGDKGGIDALIKLIRQKKTKKQKTENTTLNPIICIGNHENDKKIRELMKACHVFEVKTPTSVQIDTLLHTYLPPYDSFDVSFKDQIVHYIQGDLRKLFFLQKLWKNKPEMLQERVLQDIFHVKISNEDAKKNTWNLLQRAYPIEEHNVFMNETDRTTVALLWHENVLQCFAQQPIEGVIPFYCVLLKNICFADYIGRITFQSQIWQFNEMTSLIKTFYNNQLLHDMFPQCGTKIPRDAIEFTKVLTKYSTEYNNQMFLQSLCQRMNMDKKDVLSFFQELRLMLGKMFYSSAEKLKCLDVYFQKDEIDLLDVKRIYRFLDKNVKKEDEVVADSDND